MALPSSRCPTRWRPCCPSPAAGARTWLTAAGGRDTFEMSLDMLATRGTLVLYGQSSGPVAPFDPGRLSGITGTGRGAGSLTLSWVAASHYLTSQHDRAAAVSAILAQLTAGRFSPRIAARFPLSSASGLHTRLASRTVLGKILLQHDCDQQLYVGAIPFGQELGQELGEEGFQEFVPVPWSGVSLHHT